MSKFGLNPYVKLVDLLAPPSKQVASVQSVNSDGTVTVVRRGGGVARIRASQTLTAGEQVIIQGSTVLGKAPTLPSSITNI